MNARAILLVEKSMFKRKKKRKKGGKGNGTEKKNRKLAAEISSDSESDHSDSSNKEESDGAQGPLSDGKDWGKKVCHAMVAATKLPPGQPLDADST